MNAIEADATCADINWTRIKSDVNGNPRFVCDFTDLEGFTLRFHNRAHFTISQRYAMVIHAANQLGGRKYHNKSYGGGIVFQAYEHQLADLAKRTRAILERAAA